MRFSIIVPVYNTERYLKKCIDSILIQKFSDFELILVDDGSEDGCGDMCDQYVEYDSRVRVIHKKNMGVSAARNDGLDKASGDYILFVDSDDWIENNCLEVLNDVITENIDVVVFGLKQIFENKIDIVLPESSVESNEIKEKFISDEYKAWTCNKCYRRSLFLNVRFKVGVYYEDIYTLPRMIYNAKSIVIIKKALYCYNRMNASSITNDTTSLKMYDLVTARKKNSDFAYMNSLKCFQKCVFKMVAEAINCIILNISDSKLSKEQEIQLMEIIRSNRKIIVDSRNNYILFKYYHGIAKIEKEKLKKAKYYICYACFKLKYILDF